MSHAVHERTRKIRFDPPGPATDQGLTYLNNGARGATVVDNAPGSAATQAPDIGHHVGQFAIYPSSPSAAVLQRELTVSNPGDASEVEADRTAEEIMIMQHPEVGALSPSTPAAGTLQRACSTCDAAVRAEGVDDDDSGGGPMVDSGMPVPEEPTEGQESEESQGDTQVASPTVCDAPLPELRRHADHANGQRSSSSVEVSPGGGQPLGAPVREFFEPRFGHSFDSVRVHTDTRAAESAQQLNALAYTVGSDITFGSGQFAPGTSTGQRLLAHELAHVVQQGNGLQRWAVDGPADTSTNTIVCDGSGGIRVQTGGTGNAETTALLGDCIRAHEESHRADALASNATLCKDKGNGSQVIFSAGEQSPSEIKASNVEIACLRAKLPTGNARKDKIINDRITQMIAYRDSFS